MHTTFASQLISKKVLAIDTFELTFKLIKPSIITFAPGQFVSFEIKNEDGTFFHRPYSIVNSPSVKNQISIVLKKLPDGKGSKWLCDLELGESASFQCPFGHFLLGTDNSRDKVFAATGTGIAPICSMIDFLLENEFQNKIVLYFGVRTEKHLFYQERFIDLQKKNVNFIFIPCLDEQIDVPPFCRAGRVTAFLQNDYHLIENIDLYVCGIKEMVLDTIEIFKNKGLDKRYIHFERYT